MSKYVAFLRGIGPTNPNMRNDNLCEALQSLGFNNVQAVTSTGNILFESPRTDAAAIEAEIEAAWPQKLGFLSTTIVRSLDELRTLRSNDPFKGYTHSKQTSLIVTFLKNEPAPDAKLTPATGYRIPAIFPREVCGIVDTTTTKTPDYMRNAEKLYGKHITTRTWNTVLRIIDKLDALG